MKIIALVLNLALVLGSSCHDAKEAPAPHSQPPLPVVEPLAVGPVRIGMTSGEARLALHVARRDSSQSALDCHYLNMDGALLPLAVMVERDTVVRVDVKDTGIATAAGGRVGDTEAQVLTLYPGHVQVQPHKYLPSGHYLVVTVPGDTSRQLIFETDGSRVLNYRAGRLPAVAYVEGCA